jgi:cation-transporting ATPase E
LQAVADAYPESTWTSTSHVPFSSALKWSGASFDHHGSWILGAPEMVLDTNSGVLPQAEQLASDGSRVLVVGTIAGALTVDQQLTGVVPIGFVVIDQRLRADAAETVAYFLEQGVKVKVISGDNAVTVGAIAAVAILAVIVSRRSAQ